jgi:4-amino-4-deoxy-L-arabinose transferase-like glycosyltransferase
MFQQFSISKINRFKNNIWGKPQFWILLLPLIYFAGMYLFYPYRNMVWMDFDEGIDLAKTQMFLRGYPLYSQIWDDQPPAFTYMLAGDFQLFGMKTNHGRFLVLLLACGLIWALTQFLEKVWGSWHALAGAVLLFFLPRFTDLSVSVMAGLPAIVFAMFSLWALLQWHRQHKYLWLTISAIALAFSVLTKVFTGFLAPVFMIGILLDEYNRSRQIKKWRQYMLPVLIWGLVFALLVIVPALMIIKPENFFQVFQDHLTASALEKYRNDPGYHLGTQILDARSILVLAVFGLFYSLIRKNWLSFYLASWMCIAFILLARHVPVWSHQQLLITIPGAALAGVAVIEAFRTLRQYFQNHHIKNALLFNFLALATLATLVYTAYVRVPTTLSVFDTDPTFGTPPPKPTASEVKFLAYIRQYAPQTHWFVTDLPIYAFDTNLPVPPDLVVLSSKRVETGELSEEYIIATIQKYHPELVMFGRNKFPSVRKYLQADYQLVDERGLSALYVLKDLYVPENLTE